MKMPLPFSAIMLSTAKTARLIIWQQISASKAEKDKELNTATASLPKLSIKPFSGDSAVDYPPFIEAVKATILGNPKLSDTIKLVYIHNLLRGKALAAISHHPLNSDSRRGQVVWIL